MGPAHMQLSTCFLNNHFSILLIDKFGCWCFLSVFVLIGQTDHRNLMKTTVCCNVKKYWICVCVFAFTGISTLRLWSAWKQMLTSCLISSLALIGQCWPVSYLFLFLPDYTEYSSYQSFSCRPPITVRWIQLNFFSLTSFFEISFLQTRMSACNETTVKL